MTDPMLIEAPLETDADYEAAIDRYLVAIEQTLREIDRKQEAIEQRGRLIDAKLKSIREILKMDER